MKVKEALPQWVHANVVSQILFSVSLVQRKEDIGLFCQYIIFMWMVMAGSDYSKTDTF